MKRTAFTLVEMLAVLTVMGIIALIIFPLMNNISKDFTEKSNLRIFEQMYKAGRLYYAEARNKPDQFAFNYNDFWKDANLDVNEVKYPTWKHPNENMFNFNYSWEYACVSSTELVNKGFLKKANEKEVRNRLKISESALLNVLMIAEIDGTKRVVRESALYLESC